MDPLVRAGKSVLDLLYPPRCLGCEVVSSTPFCAVCSISVDHVVDPCRRCGLPRTESPGVCLTCRVRPPPWDSATSVFLFGGAVADALKRSKYADQPELARALGRYLQLGPEADLVVPVPLHPRRLRARGFNQASQLALGAGVKPDVDAVVRVRDTPPLERMTPVERRRTMAGAFEARVNRVRRRRVLVIDDVLTSGATLEAVTTALIAARAAEVHVLTLARAVP